MADEPRRGRVSDYEIAEAKRRLALSVGSRGDVLLKLVADAVAEIKRLREGWRRAEAELERVKAGTACPVAVEAVARALNPKAFDGSMLARHGCDDLWHDQAHGYHSSCPSCGGRYINPTGKSLKRDEARAKAHARQSARSVIDAYLKATE